MRKFWDTSSFTYGFELEVGDVRRDIQIPPELGSWESSERDIVNVREPYRHVAADPLGLSPPVGGEVNLRPAREPIELVNRISSLGGLFVNHGCQPTACCTTHSHVHVRIPGLKDDIESLKRLMRYIRINQHDTIRLCGRYFDHPDIAKCPGAKSYMRYDGGRAMPEWMLDNIEHHAHDFDSFIAMHCAGKDPKSRGRPFRYAINTYCMKHIDTIEFRMFRSTLAPIELLACIDFVRRFMTAALNGGPSVMSIVGVMEAEGLTFPEMRFDIDEWRGLQATKHPETRGKKVRTLYEL